LNQLQNTKQILSDYKTYLSSFLNNAINPLWQQVSTGTATWINSSFYEPHKNNVQAVLTSIDPIINQINTMTSNISGVQQSDITKLNTMISGLLNNQYFIRSQAFFDPTNFLYTDCQSFNVLYEFYMKLFANFFRNSSIPGFPVGWNNNNEQVVRDVIIYARTHPGTYGSFSLYTQSLITQLFTLIDGDGIWALLGGTKSSSTQIVNGQNVTVTTYSGGNLSLDNNTNMFNNIINNTNYKQVLLNNGNEYVGLLAELAVQPDFFSVFNYNQSLEWAISWEYVDFPKENVNIYTPDNGGLKNISNIS
jgi:hypothetical protein